MIRRIDLGCLSAIAVGLLLLALLVVAVIRLAEYEYPAPDAQLPAGGELVYANMGGGRPVRVIQVGECFITQGVEPPSTTWLVFDRAGLFGGTEVAIDCTSGSPPVLP